MSEETIQMLHALSVLLVLLAGLFYGISKINYHIDDHHVRIRLGRWTFRNPLPQDRLVQAGAYYPRQSGGIRRQDQGPPPLQTQ